MESQRPSSARFYYDHSDVSEGARDAAIVAEFCGVLPSVALDSGSSEVLAEFTAMEKMGLPTHFLPNPLSEVHTSFKTRQRARGPGSSPGRGCRLNNQTNQSRRSAPRKEPEVVFSAGMPGKWTKTYLSKPGDALWHSVWTSEYSTTVAQAWGQVLDSWYRKKASPSALRSQASSAKASSPSNSNTESRSLETEHESRHCVAVGSDAAVDDSNVSLHGSSPTDEVPPIAEIVSESSQLTSDVEAWHAELDRCADLDAVWADFHSAQYTLHHDTWKAKQQDRLLPGASVLGLLADGEASEDDNVDDNTPHTGGTLSCGSELEEGEAVLDNDAGSVPVMTSSRFSIPTGSGALPSEEGIGGSVDSEDDDDNDDSDEVLEVALDLKDDDADLGGLCVRLSPGALEEAGSDEDEENYEDEEDYEEEEGEVFDSEEEEAGIEKHDIPDSEVATARKEPCSDEPSVTLIGQKRKNQEQPNEQTGAKRFRASGGTCSGKGTSTADNKLVTSSLSMPSSVGRTKKFLSSSLPAIAGGQSNAATSAGHQIPAYPGAYEPIESPPSGLSLSSVSRSAQKKKNKNKRRKQEQRRQLRRGPSDSSLNKFYAQRYRFFSRYDEGIKMDDEGWFSVTPEKIAQRIAERCQCDLVVDAFCGVGGNAIQFAFTCERVIAIDIDPVKIQYARHNAAIYGVEDRIEFIVGDVFDVLPSLKVDVIFFSPPWGGPEYLGADEYDVFKMLPLDITRLFAISSEVSKNIAFYAPRNTRPDQFAQLAALVPSRVDVEHNYLNDKLKVLVAYFGELVDYQPEAPADEEAG